MMLWIPKDFFIHPKFRYEQKEVIDFLHNNIINGSHSLVNGPNGVGKTIISLCSALTTALNKRLKLIYLLKTHSQNNRIRDDLIKIKEKLKNREIINPEENSCNLNCIPYKGKKSMCINGAVVKDSKDNIYEICQHFRAEYYRKEKDRNVGKSINPNDYKTCRYYDGFIESREFSLHDLHPPFMNEKIPTTEELRDYGRAKKICPYYLNTHHLRNADVIICNYYYVFHRRIREFFKEAINTPFENCIFIIDECHNLTDTVLEINSSTLNLSDINRFLNWNIGSKETPVSLQKGIKRRGTVNQQNFIESILLLRTELEKDDKEFIEDYRNYKRGKTEQTYFGNSRYRTQDSISFLKKIFKFQGTEEFLEFMESGEIVSLNQYFNPEKRDLSPFEKISRFLKNWIKWGPEPSSFTCSFLKIKTEPSYKILPLDSQKFILPIIEKAYSTNHFSGTIHRHIFGPLSGLDMLNYSYKKMKYPYPDENKKVIVINDVNTFTANRKDKDNLTKINDYIDNILTTTPKEKSIAIFMIKYDFYNNLNHNILAKNKKLKSILKRNHRPYYVIGQGKDESEKIEKFRHDPGSVLIDVLGGKHSEGIDFKGDELETVIILGLPLAPHDGYVKEKSRYYDHKFSVNGEDFAYHEPAIRKVNQAAGRVIRSEEDKGIIILMGERFTWDRYNRFLSDWITEAIIYINSTDTLVNEIKDFWEI